jgi:hypothetical protein
MGDQGVGHQRLQVGQDPHNAAWPRWRFRSNSSATAACMLDKRDDVTRFAMASRPLSQPAKSARIE